MIWLPDSTVDHLMAVAGWPEFTSDRYEVIEEIGRGGMGTVYSAFDTALGREVAIKIGNALPSTELQARLTREARVIARLEHPGIVPVHDFGWLADGRPFYVMKRVHGRTLRAVIETTAPPQAERLRIFERVCEAVSFAHAHGIIHRDLKPENVMVGTFGEVMVMDWGIARMCDDQPDRGGLVMEARWRRRTASRRMRAPCSGHRALCRRNSLRAQERSITAPTSTRWGP
jgi:serine/threonine protein kinase